MSYFFLVSFLVGLLLAVRLMFFGAERLRPAPGALPLRRSEPAIVAFLSMFGLAGYLLTRQTRFGSFGAFGTFGTIGTLVTAAVLALVVAAIVTRVAIAAARMKPERDPEDPRYAHQGRVAIVTACIPANGEGAIRFQDAGAVQTLRARNIGDGAILAGQEVCIERIDDGVAHVELWSLVERRL